MKKSYIVLVLIIVGAYYLWISRPPTQEVMPGPVVVEDVTQEEEEMQKIMQEKMEATGIVIYDGSSFTPKELTVSNGTAVTFMNESAREMWVASAMHPTHKEYPGFDQLSGSDEGTTYKFVFDTVGSWGYHDHLNPSVTGKIIVE